MNKIVFCFLLFLTLGACDGFKNFMENLAKGAEKFAEVTEKVNDAVSKGSETINIATGLINGIVADSKVVTAEVKKLGDSLTTYFNSIIGNIQKIIDTTKKFAGIAYADGKKLYEDLKKQLNVNIAAAEADIKTSLESAKNIIGQFGTDVSLIYKDGKLIVNKLDDAVDLKEIMSDVKAKNKENLQAAVDSINEAIQRANALIESSKDTLAAYEEIAKNYAYDAQKKADKIVKNMNEYIAKAQKDLNSFVAAQKKNLKQILNDAEKLAKSSKSVVEQITTTVTNVSGIVSKNVDNVNTGVNQIKDIWSKKDKKEKETPKEDQELTPSERINKSLDSVKKSAEEAKATVSEATNTITATSNEIKNAVNDVKKKIVNLQYKVRATKLNIREGPGTSFNNVGTLSKGETVTVYEINDIWARIGNKKWCSMKYLKVADSEAAESVASTKASITKALDSLKSILSMF